MNALPEIYAGSKLAPGYHDPLVEVITTVARKVGVAVEDITGRRNNLTDFEREWLRGFRRHAASGECGIIYEGRHDPSVYDRCRSVAGALTRNYIEARVVPREELVTELFAGRRVDADCIIVPDLHYEGANASTRRVLNSWLTGRVLRRAQTVVAVPSRKALSEAIGDDAGDYIKHFRTLTGYIAQ